MSPLGCLRFYSKVPEVDKSDQCRIFVECSRVLFRKVTLLLQRIGSHRVTKLLNGQANKYIKKVLSTNTEKHLKVITCMYQSTYVCLQFLYSEFVLY